MRHWIILALFIVFGLGLGYTIYPVGIVTEQLRYGMFFYSLPVILIPHFFFIKQHKNNNYLAGWNVFLLSQLVRILALMICGIFLSILYPKLLVQGLLLFLVYIGAFLFFQLAIAIMPAFCGLKD